MISLRLTFNKSSISVDLIEYSNSNFASHMNDRKFISEYAFLLAEIAISHSFKLQNTVALSITEVEYIVDDAMRDILAPRVTVGLGKTYIEQPNPPH
jgi:hypothetical protein